VRTYRYTNDIGVQKQLHVGDKGEDGKYPTWLFNVREGMPCECCGVKFSSDEELEKYIEHYNAEMIKEGE